MDLNKKKQLKDMLILLSLNPSEQLKKLPDGSVKADELALDYDNVFFSTRHEKEIIDQPVFLSLLNEINEILSLMSSSQYKEKHPNVWDDSGLFEDNNWSLIRKKAKEAIGVMR
jgi:hypothetical protein